MTQWIILLLSATLYDCGTVSNQPTDIQPVTSISAPVTANSIAQEWLLADVPVERLEQIKRDLQETSQQIHQQPSIRSKQDLQAIQAENDLLIDSLNIALNSPEMSGRGLSAQPTQW